MPQSLAKILVHVIFSTKNREPILADTIHPELHAYIGGVIANHRGVLLSAGSVTDHIHLLLCLPRTMAPADMVQEIKTSSSRWLKSQGDNYRAFQWQSGYGAFSVSASHRVSVETYLANQAQHHEKISFQDEFRAFLRKYELEWDERYVWD